MGMLKIQYQSNTGPNHLRYHGSNIGQIIQYFNIRKRVNNSQHCKNMANHENPQHDLNISHSCYLQFRLLLWQENVCPYCKRRKRNIAYLVPTGNQLTLPTSPLPQQR